MRQIHGLLLVLLLATFTVWAVGCSSDDENPVNPGNPDCQVEPATLAFGDVAVNTTATETVTITNIGEGTLVGTVALFECGDEFAITAGGGAYSLTANQSKEVVVTYTPTEPGEGNCALATGADACSSISVAGVSVRVPEEIVETEDIEERNPSYSPNGEWIVYEVAETDKQGDHDLWKINVTAGTDPEALTWGDDFDTEPSWANVGETIVFESNREQNGQNYKHLWTIEVTATDGIPTPLTSGNFNDGSPVWAPDGSYIVFVTTRAGAQDELWLLPMTDGQPSGPAFVLTDTGTSGYSRSPDWSPDSQWVVYESDVEGESAIYKIAVTGGDPIRLTELAGSEGHPAWSPPGVDFSEIAYEAKRGGVSNIWVISPDGGEPMQITTDGGNWPQWHPEGTFIIYGIADDPAQDIYEVAVDWH